MHIQKQWVNIFHSKCLNDRVILICIVLGTIALGPGIVGYVPAMEPSEKGVEGVLGNEFAFSLLSLSHSHCQVNLIIGSGMETDYYSAQ